MEERRADAGGGSVDAAGEAAGLPPRPPRTQTISVLVADDHPIVREHLARVIEADRRLRVVEEAGDGEQALRLAHELRPDAMVLDVEMPKLGGAGVLRGLRAAALPIRVLIFTGHAGPGPLHDILHAEPDSLLRKGASARVICGEIVAMVRGAPSPGRHNREGAQAVAYNRLRLDARERIILDFARQERSVAELADILGVAESTAKEYRHDLCKKFEVDTMLGVVARAIRIGLLD